MQGATGASREILTHTHRLTSFHFTTPVNAVQREKEMVWIVFLEVGIDFSGISKRGTK
jgi:hypothetical protein